jgi:hypothetical protein
MMRGENTAIDILAADSANELPNRHGLHCRANREESSELYSVQEGDQNGTCIIDFIPAIPGWNICSERFNVFQRTDVRFVRC